MLRAASGASAHRFPESSRRRAEDCESCEGISVRGVVIEHSGRDQVARHVDASQAVRRLTPVAEAGGLHDGTTRGHVQQGCEVRLGLNGGAADGGAQCRLGGGPLVQSAPAADVQDLAVRATDEVAFAMDLLYEAFALEYGEGSPQGHRADLVLVGKSSFGQKAFAGLKTARGDLLTEVIGDVVVT